MKPTDLPHLYANILAIFQFCRKQLHIQAESTPKGVTAPKIQTARRRTIHVLRITSSASQSDLCFESFGEQK